MAVFAGFSPDALKFLKALKKNNNREWFQPRKEEYERLWRNPMLELVAALQTDVAKVRPRIHPAGTLKSRNAHLPRHPV